VYAKPSAAEFIVMEDTAARAAAAIVCYLIFGLFRGTSRAEKNPWWKFVELVGHERRARATEHLTNLHILRRIWYLTHLRNRGKKSQGDY
jgi:hypothetical protein